MAPCILSVQQWRAYTIRVRYHYDDRPKNEQNWNFPLQLDPSAREEVDDISAFAHQLKHFIATTRRKVKPKCSVEDGLRAVLVTEAAFQSLKSGKPKLVEKL